MLSYTLVTPGEGKLQLLLCPEKGSTLDVGVENFAVTPAGECYSILERRHQRNIISMNSDLMLRIGTMSSSSSSVDILMSSNV